ncbi:MAG: CYTH domain-containing protein [Bacteroidetes bacterium]|nr:CYTH domain-containing protein [Bacteroidota bacterium]
MKLIEMKARCSNPSKVRHLLLQQPNIQFIGVDSQVDTYFKIPSGRLKLREGNIENSLIYYDRENKKDAKKSDVTLYKSTEIASLKAVLVAALPILIVVEKKREIYFIDHIKFHIDTLTSLGSFLEIEVIDANDAMDISEMRQQCERYMKLLDIQKEDLMEHSYSEMLQI